jgi:hypothetical protein
MAHRFAWEADFEFDYLEEADILEVFFRKDTATNAVEIADDVTLRFDEEKRVGISLILNNYSYLVEPDQYGQRSFRLKVDHLSLSTQEVILEIIGRSPVNRFIRMLSFSDSSSHQPILIAAIEPA